MPLLPKPETPLSDGTVTLRPFAMDDVGDVTAACQDPEISRWTASIPFPYTEDDARSWISTHDDLWERGEVSPFAIIGSEDEFLGAVSLIFAGEGSAQAGYWVARWGRNRGVATAALRIISHWGFTVIGLDSINLATMIGNVASERVAEKAGFIFVREDPDYRPPRRPEQTYPVKQWIWHGV